MAAVREQLTLVDKFSQGFSRFVAMAERAAGSSRAAQAAAASYEVAAKAAGASTAQAAAPMRSYESVASSLQKQLVGLNAKWDALIAEQERMVDAGQQDTAEFAKLDKQIIDLAGTLKMVEDEFDSVNEQMDSAAQAAEKEAEGMEKASGAGDKLARKLQALVGAYMSLRGLKGILEMSDTLAQTTARLDMMNDGLQTTAELNDMIFRSAQRARGSFADTADLVGKLGNLAGDAFGSTREIVAFAEQINKQIALSGASAAGAQGALLQLTQALSSGTLRGEELNSILEQTPTIAKTIADYLGLSIGEMRTLASEGAITADVVKNAVFAAADETNRKFEQMPMTWSQIWTQFQNAALQTFQPVLAKLSQLANSAHFQQFVNMTLQGIGMVANAALAAFGWIADMAIAISDNWGVVGPIFWGVAAAIAAYEAAALLAAIAQNGLNLAMLASPLTWVAIGIGLIVAALALWANKVGGVKIAWMMAMDMIQTAWDYTVLGVYTGVYSVMGWLDDFAFGWQSAGVAVADYMGAMKVKVLTILQNMVNGAIDIINSFIGLLNNLPGVEISAISGVTFAAAAAMEEAVASSMRNSDLGIKAGMNAAKKALRQNDLNSRLQGLQADHQGRLTDITLARISQGINSGKDSSSGLASVSDEFGDIYSAASGGMGDALGGIGDSVGGSLGSDVGAIKKEVQMADEDLKRLVDMAEREYVNKINLTAQTPVINVNGQNTGNTAADRRALANAIRDILLEQKASASVRSIATPT